MNTNERKYLAADEIEFAEPSTPPLTEEELRLLHEHDRGETSASRPAHTWEPVDIVALAAEPPAPPEIGDLLYPGKRHVLSGESEAGKSFLLLALSGLELAAGRGVVWVDTDTMGAAETLERLRALGVDDERISDRFAFMEPAEPLTDAAAADLTAWLAKHHGRLIVFDAFNATLSLHGLDPHSTADVEKFWKRVVDPFCVRGVAAVLPDHVVKKSDERGKYAYGSERKHTGAEVHIGVKAIDPFGRGRTGKAKLTVHKDRPGFLERPSPGLFVLASDAASGRCTWTIEVEHDVSDEGAFRPTRLMQNVSRYLFATSEPCSRNQIENDVKGKSAYVRQAIDTLVAEGYANEVVGDRGARLVKHLRLFNEDDE